MERNIGFCWPVETQNRANLSWIKKKLRKKKNVEWLSEGGTGTEAQQCAHSPPPHAVPWCFLTFFLSHTFFLPGAAKQHQPHPPTDAELRERASRLCLTDKRRVRAAGAAEATAQPSRRSSRLLRLPAARFLRRFIQDRLRPIRMEGRGEGNRRQPISERPQGRGGGARIRKQAVRWTAGGGN